MWNLIVLTAVLGQPPLANVLEIFPSEQACMKYLPMAEEAVEEVKKGSPDSVQAVACMAPPDRDTIRRSLRNFKDGNQISSLQRLL